MKKEKNGASQDLAEVINATKPGSPFRRIWIWVALAVLAVVAGFLLFKNSGNSRPVESQFVTETIRRGNIEMTITATGNLEPTNKVTIGSELSGTTAEVFVEANDLVTVGEELARIDVRGLTQQINSSRAAVNSAEAKVKQAEATLEENRATMGRLEELRRLSRGTMPSEADLNAAKAAVTRAEADLGVTQASVAQARASLEANEEEQSKAILRSPINGIVLTRDVEPGQTVAASFSAPELFVVAEDLKKMKLQVAIAEADIGRVETGQPATFTVDAWPSRKYDAKVKKVSFGAEVVDNVVTYETELEVANEDLSLRPGMTATADIRVARREGVLLVPDAALRFSPDMKNSAPAAAEDGKSFLDNLIPRMRRRSSKDGGSGPSQGKGKANQAKIWLLREGTPVSVSTGIGLRSGGLTEVSGNSVSEGDSVILRKNVSAK